MYLFVPAGLGQSVTPAGSRPAVGGSGPCRRAAGPRWPSLTVTVIGQYAYIEASNYWMAAFREKLPLLENAWAAARSRDPH